MSIYYKFINACKNGDIESVKEIINLCKNMNISEFENIKKYVYDIGKIKVIENITNISNQPFEHLILNQEHIFGLLSY